MVTKCFAKGAQLNFNRALVRLQKGIYCKISKHLFKAKRAYIDFKGYENNLHTLTNKGAKLILEDEKMIMKRYGTICLICPVVLFLGGFN